MENFIDTLLQPFVRFWGGFVEFLPGLLATVLIIGIGTGFAWAVKAAFRRLFVVMGFDAWCDKAGITAVIRRAGIWTKPAEMFVNAVFWFLTLIFLMIGLSALRFQAIDSLIMQFFMYLPRAFSAIIIMLVGYVIAGFMSRAVLIAAVNSGYHYAKFLAEGVRLLLIVLILAMALEQLQIAPGIVIAAFTIIFGGIVLSLSIAFGVGGIDSARKLIERYSEEKKNESEINHL